MAENELAEIDPINDTDTDLLDQFDADTDEELEQAGDDPVKLKEIVKARTATRQRLYARTKKAESDLKTLKDGVEPKKKEPEPKKGTTSKELGYDQKAFLIASGIKGAEEFAIIQEVMNNTGKSLEDILEMKYVQAELKDLREYKATEDATPKGDKSRGGQSARNTVEFWIDKGELPPIEQTDLRRKVVAEKIKRDSGGNKFGGGK